MRERKKANEKERKVPSDENEARGQNEDAPKQGLSTICHQSNLCLGVCLGNAKQIPYSTFLFIDEPLCNTHTGLFVTWDIW